MTGASRFLTDVVAPLRHRRGDSELSFFSITAVIGTPIDVTVNELAIGSFYPANQATAAALHELPSPTGSTAAGHNDPVR